LVTGVNTIYTGAAVSWPDQGWEEAGQTGAADAVAFTWRSVLVPVGAVVSRAVIVRFGAGEVELKLDLWEYSPTMSSVSGLNVTVSVSASIKLAAGVRVRLLVGVDGAAANDLVAVGGEFEVGAYVTFYIGVAQLGINVGLHELVFFAVSTNGDVSGNQSAPITVLEYKPTSTDQPQEENAKSGGIGGGAIAGIVIGAIVVVAGAAVAIYFFCIRRDPEGEMLRI
jgi:hypothetical protein